MGLKEWAEKASSTGVFGVFEGIVLKPGEIMYKGQGGSVKDAVARVESAADVQSRVTATRLLALGIFAFAVKKKQGNVYLTVEHPDYQFVVEISVKKETEARKFAAKINTAAKFDS